VILWRSRAAALGSRRRLALPRSIRTPFLDGLWFVTQRKQFSDIAFMTRLWRIDWTLMRQIVSIGRTDLVAFMLRICAVLVAGLLMALISTRGSGGAPDCAQVAYPVLVPLGIGIAATIRVGHAVGRSHAARSTRRPRRPCCWRSFCERILTIAVMLARDAIARFLLGERL